MRSVRKNNPFYEILISRIGESPAVDTERLAGHVRMVLERFGVPGAHVDVAIVDDATIRRVHAEYLDDDSTTDVISFDLSDDDENRCFEIVVNESQAARESARRGLGLDSELALYVTHGLLHQLGYDDAEADAAAAMHRKEDKLLEQSGYGTTYHK